jgi:transcriptional regulator with XRE-family HTH domain
MNKKSVEQLLTEIDNFSQIKRISKRKMAQKLGIPYETFRKWVQKGKSRKNPSSEYIEKMEKFLKSQKETDTYWRDLWMKILEWWKSQHRYSTIRDLAEEIGWDVQSLTKHLQNKEMPPKLVIEKIAKTAGFEISSLDSLFQEAQQRIVKVKYFLLLLEYELRWFRDGSKEGREIFQKTLDPSDIGYISSLLTMLGDEGKFRRWITLTTNRFNFFKKKERQK